MDERKLGWTWDSLDNLAEGGDRCSEGRMEECTCRMERKLVKLYVVKHNCVT